jgi:hypothetical protein
LIEVASDIRFRIEKEALGATLHGAGSEFERFFENAAGLLKN